MKKLLMALLLATSSVSGLAQNSPEGNGASKDFKLRGPMGVIQLPRKPVKAPRAIRALLPHDAHVRLLQPLELNPKDTLVVYDRPNPADANAFIEIRYPAVLVLRENHIVGRFSLKPRTDEDADWIFLEAGEIHLSGNKAGVALAFRSLGDGSASLFLVISPEGEKYRIILRKITTEGRLRADQAANLEFWDAGDGGECIWCNHPYRILQYRWEGSYLTPVRKTNSCQKLSPDKITDNPIELLTEPLDIEYANAQQERKQHKGICDPRDPTRNKPPRSAVAPRSS